MKELNYTVVIEKADHNYAAYVPDLAGCVTTGRTLDEVLENIRDAIALYLEDMQADGEPIPEPTTTSSVVEAKLPAA